MKRQRIFVTRGSGYGGGVDDPGDARVRYGKWMDLNMMMMATGRERTAAEFRDLFNQAGFVLEEIVPTRSPLSIVVGKPRA